MTRRYGRDSLLIATLAAVFLLAPGGAGARSGADVDVEKLVARMSVDEKVGQLFMVGIRGQKVTDDTRRLIGEYHPGGFFLAGGKNIVNRRQTAEFTEELQAAAMAAPNGVPLLISTDQEGGVGSHVNVLTGGVDTVGNLALGASPFLEDTYVSYSIMADDLRAYGLNVALAPVLDVLLNKDNPMNHIRSFGADPAEVSARGREAVRGFQDNGVIACAKHFPGKGDTPVDSHVSAPVTGEDRGTLDRTILPPFRAAVEAGVDSIMLNHEVYTALDPDNVATVSEPIIAGLLKGEMGFAGIVITDSITMGGMTGTLKHDEAAYLAIRAGADMVLYARDAPELLAAAVAKVREKLAGGELNMERVDDAVTRILRVKAKYGLFDGPRGVSAEEYGAMKRANLSASRSVALNTITVVRDTGVLPLNPDEGERILVVSPGSFFTVPLMESLFPVGTSLGAEAGKAARGLRVAFYDLKTLERDAPRALALAQEVDVVVFGSIHAYWSPEIVDFVGRLESTGKPVVVVGMSVPYDVEKFPRVDAFVAAYSPRSVSLEAAVKVLFGFAEPKGRPPVGLDLD
ncbi:MAG: glycoside hydrolase family 3 N-terminal domain-containing protein [bacterium]